MAIFKITEVNITKIEIILTSTRHQTICSVIENLKSNRIMYLRYTHTHSFPDLTVKLNLYLSDEIRIKFTSSFEI
jgi:hypothetical protein